MFYGVSPNEVENEWTYLDYLDRFEFMMVEKYCEAKASEIDPT